eukprot:2928888-Prymnesium_polylepis.1
MACVCPRTVRMLVDPVAGFPSVGSRVSSYRPYVSWPRSSSGTVRMLGSPFARVCPRTVRMLVTTSNPPQPAWHVRSTAQMTMWLAAVTSLPWRTDGRCGPAIAAPDGTKPARCNPMDSERSCCSASGTCISSGCSCKGCVEYGLRQTWRNDGQCGPDLAGADGTRPATCNPMDQLNRTCCSDVG